MGLAETCITHWAKVKTDYGRAALERWRQWIAAWYGAGYAK